MTISELIREALRLTERLRFDDEPLPSEYANGLIVAQSMYDGLVSSGVFGRAVDMLEDADYTAEEADRIFNSTGSNIAITLPETVQDAFTGDDRPPNDYSLVRIAGATAQTYLYSAPFGAWMRMTSLALTDTAPLAERGSRGLAAMLAEHLAGPDALSPGLRKQAAAFRSTLALKLDRPRTTVCADYF